MDIAVIILQFAAVFGLVFLNGFFVAAEFAIVKVRSTQIEPLLRSGGRRARLAHHVTSHLDAYLSATQLGITLTSLGLGWIGEPFVASIIEPLLGMAGMTRPAMINTLSFTIGFSFITFLHIVLGELAPKSLAIQRAQATTLATATPLHVFFLVFRPFIWLLNGTANYFLRLVGIQPASDQDLAHSEEELRLLLSKGRTISATTRRILLRTMELRSRTVREIMVPRTGIAYLSTDRTLDENIRIALDNQFTRYPLCEGNLDNVVGMVHLKDLFKLNASRQEGDSLGGIRREMLFIPETLPLERTLSTFLAKRMLMAMAVDEYGGTAGLVTLENVLEELVGEIRDEFDIEPAEIQKLGEDEYVVSGTMPLHDFARTFEITPDSKEVVTVSGYVIQLLGRVPEKGAAVGIGQWTATVESLEGKTVRSVRMKRAGGSKDGHTPSSSAP
jgi:CBS domain containing-hemolysin-like protein